VDFGKGETALIVTLAILFAVYGAACSRDATFATAAEMPW
jgi:hypothetical protein